MTQLEKRGIDTTSLLVYDNDTKGSNGSIEFEKEEIDEYFLDDDLASAMSMTLTYASNQKHRPYHATPQQGQKVGNCGPPRFISAVMERSPTNSISSSPIPTPKRKIFDSDDFLAAATESVSSPSRMYSKNLLNHELFNTVLKRRQVVSQRQSSESGGNIMPPIREAKRNASACDRTVRASSDYAQPNKNVANLKELDMLDAIVAAAQTSTKITVVTEDSNQDKSKKNSCDHHAVKAFCWKKKKKDGYKMLL